jgi:hypothetical protein
MTDVSECQRVIPITDYAELSSATIGYAGMLSSRTLHQNAFILKVPKLLLSSLERSEPRLDTRETSIILKPHGLTSLIVLTRLVNRQ